MIINLIGENLYTQMSSKVGNLARKRRKFLCLERATITETNKWILLNTHYFHDGYVNNISHVGNNISFSLESSVIENLYEIVDKNLLSASNTFKGKLNIYNIKSFKLGNKKYKGVFKMQYDDGEILDLEIKDNKIFLLVEWKNFPPKTRKTDVSKIEIEAEKIQWVPEKL